MHEQIEKGQWFRYTRVTTTDATGDAGCTFGEDSNVSSDSFPPSSPSRHVYAHPICALIIVVQIAAHCRNGKFGLDQLVTLAGYSEVSSTINPRRPRFSVSEARQFVLLISKGAPFDTPLGQALKILGLRGSNCLITNCALPSSHLSWSQRVKKFP